MEDCKYNVDKIISMDLICYQFYYRTSNLVVQYSVSIFLPNHGAKRRNNPSSVEVRSKIETFLLRHYLVFKTLKINKIKIVRSKDGR